jgi:crossover junction endodeoxyribonuclease RusA
MNNYIKEIVLPWPDGKLTPHAKGHWRPKAAATKEARNMAWAKAMEKPAIQTIPNAVIFVEYYPKARRGDVHNMHGRMKAYIDGIADAMGCDDRKFKVEFPSVWAGTDPRGKVVFRVMYPFAVIPVTGEIR